MKLTRKSAAGMTALSLVLLASMTAYAGPRSGGGGGGSSGGGSTSGGPSGGSTGGSTDPFPDLPAAITMWGTCRDFRERHTAGGHEDFEREPTAGFGHYVGMVAYDLDAEGKPVMATTGYKVSSEWRDSSGRQIMPPSPHVQQKVGDVIGAASTVEGGALTSASNFNSWFRDIPGVNMSAAIPIQLERQPNTNLFVFDDSLDTQFASLNGFFIVNDQLFGNSQGGNKNYHYTYEIEAEFTYHRNMGQYFTFSGNDDVWVFIDDKLVVDLGGVRARITQTIETDRLSWLVDGERFRLKFFFSQRHRTESRFRIETNMMLQSVQPPATSAMFD